MNLIEAYGNRSVVSSQTSFKEKTPYKDPLKEWPLRGCAYSNEIGAAIHSVSPKLGTALWIPALMYFGAAIYDKYKNDETEYNPSARRGFQETVFQALASVFMPTAAVCLGQRAASSLHRFGKNGLSVQSQIDVLEKSNEYMQSNSLHTFEKNPKAYAQGFQQSIVEAAGNANGNFKALSPVKKFLSMINPFNDSDNMALADKSKLANYANAQAEEVMRMREQLMQNKKPENMSLKMFEKFQKSLTKYKENYSQDKYMGKAAKSILQDYHNDLIFKNKLIKTLGGFISLFLMIKPIDNFVENIVIKKTVEPGLDYLSSKRNS